jgi:RNA polymerase sigma-70 factor (ECF subfamily)
MRTIQNEEESLMSRKITAHLFHSVNGVVESPNLWQFDAFGPEGGQQMGEAIAPVTAILTYALRPS